MTIHVYSGLLIELWKRLQRKKGHFMPKETKPSNRDTELFSAVGHLIVLCDEGGLTANLESIRPAKDDLPMFIVYGSETNTFGGGNVPNKNRAIRSLLAANCTLILASAKINAGLQRGLRRARIAFGEIPLQTYRRFAKIRTYESPMTLVISTKAIRYNLASLRTGMLLHACGESDNWPRPTWLEDRDHDERDIQKGSSGSIGKYCIRSLNPSAYSLFMA